MNEIVWLSVDPVRKIINYYPKEIATIIEKKFEKRKEKNDYCCELGEIFHSATIHFKDQNYYQTTPGITNFRYYKQPGFRSVMRYVIKDKNYTLNLSIKKFRGEWRINYDDDSRYDLGSTYDCIKEKIPLNVIINSDTIDTSLPNIDTWNPSDLTTMNDDKIVIIWEWCFGVPEKQGDLYKLSNRWWIPYLYRLNVEIEENFKKSKNTNIYISGETGERYIEFIPGNNYAYQRDKENKKCRLIRRRLIHVGELRNLINKSKFPIDINQLSSLINNEDIPIEFYCPISQDIIKNPVKTIDGFTYDKEFIEKWLEKSMKSPLTGLDLTSTKLTFDEELYNKLEIFTKFLIEKNKS